MPTILERLHGDHRNMSRILDLLERELHALEHDGSPDTALMLDAMHYLTHYSDSYHHPVEDVVFDHVQEVRPRTGELVRQLRAEHVQLAEDGRALYEVLREVEADVAVTRQTLAELAERYVVAQRRHMNFEEGELFPLARHELDEAAWGRVERAVETGRDPLFGRLLDQEYRALYTALQESGD